MPSISPLSRKPYEEEFALAEELYRAAKIRNIALFFKDVDQSRRNDPGPQLKAVLDFKRRIEDEKRYLFRQYKHSADFIDTLEVHLANWLRDHQKTARGSSMLDPVAETASPISGAGPSPTVEPTFDYWINEAKRLADASTPDYAIALFCSEKAIDASRSDKEWAKAKNHWGIYQFHLGKLDEAMGALTEVAERLGASQHPDHGAQVAQALGNLGIALGQLGRGQDELAAYDDLIARFSSSAEPNLLKYVAKALRNKGITLGELGRNQDELAAYDDLIARFGSSAEPALREQVARALFDKGVSLGELGRSKDALAAYDDLLARFGSATEPTLQKIVDDARRLRDSLGRKVAR